jgi:hypothetical protein
MQARFPCVDLQAAPRSVGTNPAAGEDDEIPFTMWGLALTITSDLLYQVESRCCYSERDRLLMWILMLPVVVTRVLFWPLCVTVQQGTGRTPLDQSPIRFDGWCQDSMACLFAGGGADLQVCTQNPSAARVSCLGFVVGGHPSCAVVNAMRP